MGGTAGNVLHCCEYVICDCGLVMAAVTLHCCE